MKALASPKRLAVLMLAFDFQSLCYTHKFIRLNIKQHGEGSVGSSQ